MKGTKKLTALSLVIVSVLTIALPALAYIWVYMNVPAGKTVNVRDWPDGNEVFSVPRSTQVDVQAYANPTWSKVVVPGYSDKYYIKPEFLSPTPPAAA